MRTAVARVLGFESQLAIKTRVSCCRPHTVSSSRGRILTSTHQKAYVLMHENYPNPGR